MHQVKTLNENSTCPVFPVKICDVPLQALYDTGASISVLCRTIFDKLKQQNLTFQQERVEIPEIVAANGDLFPVLGMFKIPLTVEGCTKYTSMYVSSQPISNRYHLIMGIDQIHALDLGYCPKKSQVTLGNRPIQNLTGRLSSLTPKSSNKETPWITERIKEVDPSMQQSLRQVLREYEDVFAIGLKDLAATHVVCQEVPLSDDIPVYIRPYKIPQKFEAVMEDKIHELPEFG